MGRTLFQTSVRRSQIRANTVGPRRRLRLRSSIESLESRVLLSTDYHLSFDEEFNGTALDTGKWTALPRWGNDPINNELQIYKPEAVTVSGGLAHLTATHLTTPINFKGVDYWYKSGEIQTFQKYDQQYGGFEIRMKSPAGKGFWPAFWLLPEDVSWPPEVDIVEILGNQEYQNQAHFGYIMPNGSGGTVGSGGWWTTAGFSITDYHTYAVKWDSTAISWWVDGIQVRSDNSLGDPYKPMYLIANLAVGGNWPGAPDANTVFPNELSVDYIRAYSNDPSVPTVTPQSGYANSTFFNAINATGSGALVNGDFEGGNLSGWTTVSSGGYGSGAWVTNNVTDQSNTYPRFSNPLPGTAGGTYYAQLSGYGSSATSYLYQDIGTLLPNTTYTLTTAIGVARYDFSPAQGSIRLINGTNQNGTVLASASSSSLGLGQYANNFKDLTVTFTTGSSVSGDLTVAIASTGGYSGYNSLSFDNVRLTVVTTAPTVANPDFEGGSLSGWTTVSSGGYGSGAWVTNNVTDQSNTYPRFSNPLPGTAGGTYYAQLSGYGSSATSYLYQDVGVLQPNTTYTMTVAIGVARYDWSPAQGSIRLINGTNQNGTLLASASSSTLGLGQYANNFKDLIVTFTTGSSVSGDLVIAIASTGGYSGYNSLSFDSVRLAASAAMASAKLTGTVIGTTGSWTTGNTGVYIAADGANAAFDGNLSSFFDPPSSSTQGSQWVGLDLGTARTITAVKVAPRSGFAGRLVGARIQVSTDGVNWTTAYTISAAPTEGVLTTYNLSLSGTFRYVRAIGASDQWFNLAELEVWGY